MEVSAWIEDKALTKKRRAKYAESYEESESKGYLIEADGLDTIGHEGDGSLYIGIDEPGGAYFSVKLDLKRLLAEDAFWKALDFLANEIRDESERKKRILRLAELG